MDVELYKIVVDSSLFVLIWMVQLVVYPGFNYYSELNMKRWHSDYTTRITVIVLPLMVGQLGLYSYTAYYNPSYRSVGGLALVVATWVVTFLVSVPLHNAIEKRSDSRIERKELVQTNWIRTFIWTIILILSIIFYGK
jgi:hypothetical protein